jgi:hypothetical protein
MLRFLTSRAFATKAKPDPLIPAAVQLWEQRYQKPKELEPELDPLFDHEMYTPPATPSTGLLNPLPKPLHFPAYDQSKRSIQKTGLDSIATYFSLIRIDNKTFDDRFDAPIGDYPRLEQQWTALKDPLGYWDKQGRRNYGEIVQDMDNFTDIWGIGPEQCSSTVYGALLRSVGFVLVICGMVYAWDPTSHRLWVYILNVGGSELSI